MAANPEQKQQFLESLKQGTHILVTVKTDPTIDQLAACIALTVLLNGLGKRATAVFSGKIPQAIDFLKPGKMLQSNTDSLQDFIISLDKAKADKLRYKVEDTMVKIYITPYQASLSDRDLVYSKGDFNVDTVVALGAHSQSELDKAITAHGRILHDAKVLTMDTVENAASDLGSVNWADASVSSLSELVARSLGELASENPDALDSQVATALLAGIVAETQSFGNGKTTPMTMEVAGHLLAAGANQELVSSRLSGTSKPASSESGSNANNANRKQKNGQPEKTPLDLNDGASEEFNKAPSSGNGNPNNRPKKGKNRDNRDNRDKGGKPSEAAATEPKGDDNADGVASSASVAGGEVDTAQVLEELSGMPDFEPATPAPAVETAPTENLDATGVMSADTVTFDHGLNQPAVDAAEPAPTVQPLRDQSSITTEPPLFDKVAAGATDPTLDPSLFATTPPANGQQLDATSEVSGVTSAPANPLAEDFNSAPAAPQPEMLGVIDPGELNGNPPSTSAPGATPPTTPPPMA